MIAIKLPTYLSEFHFKEFGLDDYEVRTVTNYANRALDAFHRGEAAQAREHVELAMSYSEDADLYLIRAAVATDDEDQMKYIDLTLSLEPHNPEALRAKGALDGTLDKMMAEPEAGEGDEMQANAITCPRCNGVLALREDVREVTCSHCGYVLANLDERSEETNKRALLYGMMRRDAQPSEWNIGERWLRCTACNAKTTFNRPALSQACRFCGSLAVVKETSNNRFEQPDLMVPFEVEEDRARLLAAQVAERKQPTLKRLFSGPPKQLDRLDVNGVYLPFWVIDADMEVRRRVFEVPGQTVIGPGIHLDDVLFFAASTLPAGLVDHAEPFDLQKGVPYDPHLLVEYPAELYEIDLDRAAIEVRDKLQRLARRHPKIERTDTVQTRGMLYKLALLPVYMVRVSFKDGTVQRGVINGQSGRLAFEKR